MKKKDYNSGNKSINVILLLTDALHTQSSLTHQIFMLLGCNTVMMRNVGGLVRMNPTSLRHQSRLFSNTGRV